MELTEKLKEIIRREINKFRGSVPENAVLPQVIIDAQKWDAARRSKERRIYRRYIRKCVKIAREEFAGFKAKGLVSDNGECAQKRGGDWTYVHADGIGFKKEDWDTYFDSAVRRKYIDLGWFGYIDTGWPSYLWGEFKRAFGSPLRLTSLEDRLRRGARPLPFKRNYRGWVGDFQEVYGIRFICVAAMSMAVCSVYHYIRYMWFNDWFLLSGEELVSWGVTMRNLARDLIFWAPPGTPKWLLIPNIARFVELYFSVVLTQYVYYAYLRNVICMGFTSYRSFMTRGFGDFETYKELFYSLPVDSRVRMEVRAMERFEFELARLRVIYYGDIVMPDLALAELSDYSRRAVYYDVPGGYIPSLYALKGYASCKFDYNSTVYFLWFIIDCIRVGSRITGVPIIYSYVRDRVLDARDAEYCAKKKFPFVPRLDPGDLEVMDFITRYVYAEDGSWVTEHVSWLGAKLTVHLRLPDWFIEEMKGGFHDDIIKLP